MIVVTVDITSLSPLIVAGGVNRSKSALVHQSSNSSLFDLMLGNPQPIITVQQDTLNAMSKKSC